MSCAISNFIVPLKMIWSGTTRHAGNHIDVDAHRGREDTHFGNDDDNNAEPNRVISQRGDDGEKYGNGAHDHGQRIYDDIPG